MFFVQSGPLRDSVREANNAQLDVIELSGPGTGLSTSRPSSPLGARADNETRTGVFRLLRRYSSPAPTVQPVQCGQCLRENKQQCLPVVTFRQVAKCVISVSMIGRVYGGEDLPGVAGTNKWSRGMHRPRRDHSRACPPTLVYYSSATLHDFPTCLHVLVSYQFCSIPFTPFLNGC